MAQEARTYLSSALYTDRPIEDERHRAVERNSTTHLILATQKNGWQIHHHSPEHQLFSYQLPLYTFRNYPSFPNWPNIYMHGPKKPGRPHAAGVHRYEDKDYSHSLKYDEKQKLQKKKTKNKKHTLPIGA